MARLYIVDGYNVIYNLPELKVLSEESLEQAREKLVERLINFSEFTGDEVRVVFDGHLVKKGKGSKEKRGAVLVMFTRYGLTADELIEKMIIKESGQQVYVVTSDGTEQWVAFGRGAYRMTPNELFKEMSSIQQEIEIICQDPGDNNRYLYKRLDSKIRDILERFRRGK